MERNTVRFNAILILLISVFFFGCSTTPNSNSAIGTKTTPLPEVENHEQYIKQTLVNMWNAIEKGDMERYASYIHPDFTQFGETAKVLRVGKEAEVKGIREWVEEPMKVHTEMKDPRVTIRGDTAWITYYWSDSGTSKGKPFATKGKSTRIFVKEKEASQKLLKLERWSPDGQELHIEEFNFNPSVIEPTKRRPS